MRLLKYGDDNVLHMTADLVGTDVIPPYAILSHTWEEGQEVLFDDWNNETNKNTLGFRKILFCAQQARRDGLTHFWVDTCCINKTSSAELTEAINSMFKWYQRAALCYVYLADVSTTSSIKPWAAIEKSRWFTRGWTLQELLAPALVQFFTRDGVLLGDKISLSESISKRTGIPISALQGTPLEEFDIDERMRWAKGRETRREEDEIYSLLGIVGVNLPLIYGEERDGASRRLQIAIGLKHRGLTGLKTTENVHWMVPRTLNSLFTGRGDMIDRICRHLQSERGINTTEQKRIAITGMGGQGKSEICIKVANVMREESVTQANFVGMS
jgi:hypothetical protein